MRKIRNSAIALLAAGSLALTATPAMAQSTSGSTGSSASSQVGNALGATEDERAIWGSAKDLDSVSPFGQTWYLYTLAATGVAVAGILHANIPAIEAAAAQWGIELNIPTGH